jgi:mRNA-degrading endonuclease HigB of HigAB toxin-antitoxin module
MSETTIAARIRAGGKVVRVSKDGKETPFPDRPMRPITESQVGAAAAADPNARPMTVEELRKVKRWKTPQDVKKAHPKASILKGGRVVFNIKANDYRLIVVVQYENGVMMIRFFGSHEEYDLVDAETV